VRLSGRAPSVEALIRAEHCDLPAVEFARRMRSLRLIVTCGRGLYLPSGSVALISAFDQITLQHIARSLMSLLETIGHNLSHRDDSDRLIERFAEVPDLPVTDVGAFRRFAQLQGSILMRTANDWLESRRARRQVKRKRAVTRAGIHVHAYTTPQFSRLRTDKVSAVNG
jgi:hypothetical protein